MNQSSSQTNLIMRNFELNTVFTERRTLLSKQYCKFVCIRTETKFGASCLCFLMPNFTYMYHFMIRIKDRIQYYGILLPKLIWPTVRKNCSSDREQLLKFEAEGREFAKILRSLGQFIQTVKGQNNFW